MILKPFKQSISHVVKIIFLFLTIGFLPLTYTYAQSVGTDSRGKDIFDYYQSQSLSIPISSANGSFKVTGTAKLNGGTQYFISNIPKDKIVLLDSIDATTKKKVFYYSKSDQAKLTYATSFGFIWSFSVDNIKSDLTKISTFHPTYGLTFGIGHNVDIINNWKNFQNIASRIVPVPWNINFYGKLDNVVIYDQTTQSSSRQKPFTFGMLAEASFFPASFIIISGSANIERSNNISVLKNFQQNAPYYSDPNVISLGDYVGKLGDLKHLNNYRLRLSVPIITPTINFITTLQPCIIPYYNYYGQFGGTSNHMFGFFANLLGKAFYGQNNTNVVSGAGVGFDWTHNSVWSHGVFIAGSLNLSTFFGHKASGIPQTPK